MGWSITWHFVENVILGPFASAWFAALMVKKAEPSDPASPVRTEPPARIIRPRLASTRPNAPEVRSWTNDDAAVVVVSAAVLMVLVVFLYARYMRAIWSAVAFAGAVCAGLALPSIWVAWVTRHVSRLAGAWTALTGSSLGLGALSGAVAPSFTLARTPQWILNAAATTTRSNAPAILNLSGAFNFVRHLPNPEADVLWLGLEALGAGALSLALALQTVRMLAALVYSAVHQPPALLRRLTISSDAAHYVSVSLLVVLFYLCASDKLYTALHTQSLYYLWHYWPV